MNGCFNSRTREGCDRRISSATPRRIRFNSRTHEGCDASHVASVGASSGFQFTHPRGVRRVRLRARGTERDVSIHAPARGATAILEYVKTKVKFLFTHPRGVRRITLTNRQHPTRFNSRTREGCDARKSANRHDYRRIVSIHAPARGAT